MTRIRLVIGSGLVAAIAACAVLLVGGAGGAGASHGTPGFKTAKQPFLVGTAPGVVVDPIMSTGDVFGSYQMSGIPDGLGAYRSRGGDDDDDDHGRGEFVVVMNHELGKSFPRMPPLVDARISRLEIDPRTRSVHGAEYLFTGNEGFERFCSSTLAIIFGRPFYFTGEEAIPDPTQPPGPAHDGSSIVMDPDTGMWRETAHFGHLQHENVVPLRLSKWVFLTSEDDFRAGQASYLYAYIASDFNRALRGVEGSLYVWRADRWNAASDPETGNATATKGESIPGHFVPIEQVPHNANSTALKNRANTLGAFKFDRLEDIAARPDVRGRTYIADTGKPTGPGATARGRIYQFDINRRDPTRATLKMILNGDGPNPDDIFNPDNMDASSKVLMIQEDREAIFRAGTPANSGGYGRVMEYRFSNGSLRSVARVNTPPGAPPNPENCAGCLPGTWESSGIIDASRVLGKGWWLLDVQAHNSTAPQPGPTLVPNSSTGENGQLLAIKVPDSRRGGDDDDDDDDDD
jgi:Bacterial protein of unknown function (DUF839)